MFLIPVVLLNGRNAMSLTTTQKTQRRDINTDTIPSVSRVMDLARESSDDSTQELTYQASMAFDVTVSSHRDYKTATAEGMISIMSTTTLDINARPRNMISQLHHV